MRFLTHTALLLLLTAELVPAQDSGQGVNDRPPQVRALNSGFFSRMGSPYRAKEVSPVNLQNSQRIFDLMRAGQLYLSLEDAIALALENHLDIELDRFLPKIAETALLLARGGG